jgi:hypothetical protein
MQEVRKPKPRGGFALVFFGSFLILTNSLIKMNFLKDNIKFFKLKHPKVRIDIYSNIHILNNLEQLAFNTTRSFSSLAILIRVKTFTNR